MDKMTLIYLIAFVTPLILFLFCNVLALPWNKEYGTPIAIVLTLFINFTAFFFIAGLRDGWVLLLPFMAGPYAVGSMLFYCLLDYGWKKLHSDW